MSDNGLPPLPQGTPPVPPLPPVPSAPGFAPPGAQPYPGQPQPVAPQPGPSYAQPGQQQPGPSYPVPGQPQQPFAPQPKPTRKKSRTGLIVGISIGAVVVVLGGIGLAVGGAAISSSVAPDAKVKEYLQDLVDGRAEAALTLMGKKPTGLLTDEAYAASTNHISDFSVGKPKTSGDTTTVTAKINQGGTSYTQDFVLEKEGKAFLVFDTWQLQPLGLGVVDVRVQGPQGLAVQVDGNSVDTSDESGLPAFPGDYEVTVDGGDGLFEAQPATASVVGLSDDAAGSVATAAIATTLTESGKAQAQAAIDAFIDGCIAQASLKPANCGFEARPQDGYTYSNIVWTIQTRPTVSFGDWLTEGWAVKSETAGTFNVVADSVDGAGRSGPSGTTLSNVRVSGTVSIQDGTATFTPLVLPF